MPKPLYIPAFLAIIFCFCNSCSSTKRTAHPDWVELQLPVGWTIKAPKGFKVEHDKGEDTYVGRILSRSGKLIATYDVTASGYGNLSGFSYNVQKSKLEIEDSVFKKLYKIPEYNSAYLDKIDGTVATIIKPVNKENRIIDICMSNLETGVGLNINNGSYNKEELSIEEERLLFEMFQTIKFRKEKIADFYKSFQK